ncbi:RNA polymerase II proximal promoter sequence-specific DNA binding, variant 2 [Balamuthia mandrillaris]
MKRSQAETKQSVEAAVAWLQRTYTKRQGFSTARNDVYKAYVRYCQQQGSNPLKPNILGKMMRRAFPNVRCHRVGPQGKQVYHYTGITLAHAMGSPEAASADNTYYVCSPTSASSPQHKSNSDSTSSPLSSPPTYQHSAVPSPPHAALCNFHTDILLPPCSSSASSFSPSPASASFSLNRNWEPTYPLCPDPVVSSDAHLAFMSSLHACHGAYYHVFSSPSPVDYLRTFPFVQLDPASLSHLLSCPEGSPERCTPYSLALNFVLSFGAFISGHRETGLSFYARTRQDLGYLFDRTDPVVAKVLTGMHLLAFFAEEDYETGIVISNYYMTIAKAMWPTVGDNGSTSYLYCLGWLAWKSRGMLDNVEGGWGTRQRLEELEDFTDRHYFLHHLFFQYYHNPKKRHKLKHLVTLLEVHEEQGMAMRNTYSMVGHHSHHFSHHHDHHHHENSVHVYCFLHWVRILRLSCCYCTGDVQRALEEAERVVDSMGKLAALSPQCFGLCCATFQELYLEILAPMLVQNACHELLQEIFRIMEPLVLVGGGPTQARITFMQKVAECGRFFTQHTPTSSSSDGGDDGLRSEAELMLEEEVIGEGSAQSLYCIKQEQSQEGAVGEEQVDEEHGVKGEEQQRTETRNVELRQALI